MHRLAAEAGYYDYDAANAAWVKLYVNGEFNGVFTTTEQRDEQFLRNRDLYSLTNTWLYKVDGSHTLQEGVGDSPTFLHLNFPPFVSGGQAPDLQTDLPQWIDMEGMLTLGACNAYIENTDGLFKRNGKNSFAADFLPPNQRLRKYFPWDLDTGIRQGNENIYGNFFQNTIILDPWFRRVYEHTLRELIEGPLSAASLHAFLNDLEPVLAPALASDPFISAGPGSFTSLRNWVVTRNANVLGQLTLPYVPRPTFNHPGGEVVSGFGLTMTSPAGQIYFTTDGSDPRLPGGAVAPTATLYTGPVLIDRATRLSARTLNSGNWRGLASKINFQLASFTTPIRVTEIMYHPSDPNPGDTIDKDEYEFLELWNSGTESFDLSGYFLDGITYTFPPGSVLAAGNYLVLVRNSTAFAARYPGVSANGVYLGGLSNSGEKIRLKTPLDTTVLSVEYDDDPDWVLSPDGMGYSLVNRNPDGDPDLAANWTASRDPGGSPGAADPPLTYATGLLNEVLAHSTSPYEDAVELRNTLGTTADLGGWFLSNAARNVSGTLDPILLKKYRIPDGTIVPANGYAAFYEGSFGTGNPLTPFSLSPYGGRIYLSSADPAGNLTGHLIALEFPATDPNRSFGQLTTSRGPREAVMESPTFGIPAPADVPDFRNGNGAPNSNPLIGPVVLSEVMYNPLDAGSEFVELHNLSGSPVDISGWDIDGISGFSFPGGTTLPPGGFLVLLDLAKTTEAQFRLDFSVPAAAPIFGALFDLGNGGESLRLEKPNPAAGQPDILIEKLRYNDKAPWPTEADGSGPSLERLPPDHFANEPLHWKAVTINGTPGGPGSTNGGLPIARGSFWDVYANASGLGTAWIDPAYNATSWPTVAGPAGYGEPFIVGSVPFGPDPAAKYPTTYFRKQFVIGDDPADLATLHLNMLHDDGVVVYLNGTEVTRAAMPAGAVAYETLASEDRETTDYSPVDLAAFRPLLVQGTNTLAVEVHQFGPASADLVWDADLTYTLANDPNDLDGDGMPAAWEAANGLDDNDPTDAFLDADNDGQNNKAEYLAGTDPQDPSSFFRIREIEVSPAGNVILRWDTVPGRTYRVRYSPALQSWFTFGPAGDLLATGPQLEFTDPTGSAADLRFYQLEILP
ncbi:MAG: lamin tail domain-containing protein [Verrucomicrobia bacterium]|nr:lamin tail domain-containing protein [Verrucomicrobiota bacterium]